MVWDSSSIPPDRQQAAFLSRGPDRRIQSWIQSTRMLESPRARRADFDIFIQGDIHAHHSGVSRLWQEIRRR